MSTKISMKQRCFDPSTGYWSCSLCLHGLTRKKVTPRHLKNLLTYVSKQASCEDGETIAFLAAVYAIANNDHTQVVIRAQKKKGKKIEYECWPRFDSSMFMDASKKEKRICQKCFMRFKNTHDNLSGRRTVDGRLGSPTVRCQPSWRYMHLLDESCMEQLLSIAGRNWYFYTNDASGSSVRVFGRIVDAGRVGRISIEFVLSEHDTILKVWPWHAEPPDGHGKSGGSSFRYEPIEELEGWPQLISQLGVPPVVALYVLNGARVCLGSSLECIGITLGKNQRCKYCKKEHNRTQRKKRQRSSDDEDSQSAHSVLDEIAGSGSGMSEFGVRAAGGESCICECADDDAADDRNINMSTLNDLHVHFDRLLGMADEARFFSDDGSSLSDDGECIIVGDPHKDDNEEGCDRTSVDSNISTHTILEHLALLRDISKGQEFHFQVLLLYTTISNCEKGRQKRYPDDVLIFARMVYVNAGGRFYKAVETILGLPTSRMIRTIKHRVDRGVMTDVVSELVELHSKSPLENIIVSFDAMSILKGMALRSGKLEGFSTEMETTESGNKGPDLDEMLAKQMLAFTLSTCLAAIHGEMSKEGHIPIASYPVRSVRTDLVATLILEVLSYLVDLPVGVLVADSYSSHRSAFSLLCGPSPAPGHPRHSCSMINPFRPADVNISSCKLMETDVRSISSLTYACIL